MRYQISDLVPQVRIAGASQRAANLIVDFFAFSFLYLIWKEHFFENFLKPFIPELNLTGEIGIIIFLYFAYYTLFEYRFGKTPAKWLTGTTVVDLNGKPPTFGAVVVRNINRLLPLNPLTFFGEEPIGWHDNCSGTRVWCDHIPKNAKS